MQPINASRRPSIALVLALVLALGLSLGAAVANAAQEDTDPAAADLASEVRATEIAFAQTMADRDHGAFASFLAEETIFFAGPRELRGKSVVAEAWRKYYEGEAAPFSWAPEVVAVLDSGTLALSSGPVLDPEGQRVGTFNSVWRRQADGSWKIVFDKGCPPCRCRAEE